MQQNNSTNNTIPVANELINYKTLEANTSKSKKSLTERINESLARSRAIDYEKLYNFFKIPTPEQCRIIKHAQRMKLARQKMLMNKPKIKKSKPARARPSQTLLSSPPQGSTCKPQHRLVTVSTSIDKSAGEDQKELENITFTGNANIKVSICDCFNISSINLHTKTVDFSEGNAGPGLLGKKPKFQQIMKPASVLIFMVKKIEKINGFYHFTGDILFRNSIDWHPITGKKLGKAAKYYLEKSLGEGDGRWLHNTCYRKFTMKVIDRLFESVELERKKYKNPKIFPVFCPM